MTHPIDTSPEAIAALLDGVTPGPWMREAQTIYANGGYQLVASMKPHEWGQSWPQLERNGDFIAAARELVPALAAEIARLTAERGEWQRQAIYHNRKHGEMLTAFRAAEAERDEARAQEAMTYEAAASLLDPEVERPADYNRNKKTAYDAGYYDARKSDASVIRALTPADAAAALSRRDAAMRNEGRRQAALLGNNLPDVRFDDRWTDYEHGVCDFQRAILAALEPEGGE